MLSDRTRLTVKDCFYSFSRTKKKDLFIESFLSPDKTSELRTHYLTVQFGDKVQLKRLGTVHSIHLQIFLKKKEESVCWNSAVVFVPEPRSVDDK